MRLGKFESAGQTPLGQGDEKKVFIDPNNESRVIAEQKKESENPYLEAEIDTPRQLKGRYYLTKIAHALLPKNIPDIYQAGETLDGAQTTDRERVAHTKGQEILQKARNEGGDEEQAGKLINEELGDEMDEVTSKLVDIGLGFNIDENLGNYTKDESGNVKYLETFNPWQKDIESDDGIELLFDQEIMREAIEKMPDGPDKKQCEGYLERLLVLAEEEKKDIQENAKEKNEQPENGPEISKLSAMFISFELKYSVEVLSAITTKAEADASEERKSAKEALVPMFTQLNLLMSEQHINQDKYNELYDIYKKFSHAVGVLDGKGMIDHTR